jgi:hypothetical protein
MLLDALFHCREGSPSPPLENVMGAWEGKLDPHLQFQRPNWLAMEMGLKHCCRDHAWQWQPPPSWQIFCTWASLKEKPVTTAQNRAQKIQCTTLANDSTERPHLTDKVETRSACVALLVWLLLTRYHDRPLFALKKAAWLRTSPNNLQLPVPTESGTSSTHRACNMPSLGTTIWLLKNNLITQWSCLVVDSRSSDSSKNLKQVQQILVWAAFMLRRGLRVMLVMWLLKEEGSLCDYYVLLMLVLCPGLCK